LTAWASCKTMSGLMGNRLIRIGFLAALPCLVVGAQDGGTSGGAAAGADYGTALEELKAAARDGSEEKAIAAMARLVVADAARAPADCIELLPSIENLAVYYGILTSLGEIHASAGLDRIAAALRSDKTQKELRRDLLISLQLNEYAAADRIVLELLKDAGLPADIRLALVEEAAKRKVKDSIPVLIELLASEESKGFDASARGADVPWNELGHGTRRALQAMSDKVFKDAKGYAEWWSANADSFKVPGRKVEGQGALERLAGSTVVRYEGLKAFLKEEVVLVRGKMDTLVPVLRSLGVPYVAANDQDNTFNVDEKLIKGARVLIVECDATHEHVRFYPSKTALGEPTRRSQRILDLIKSKVNEGMYLVTTDWGLTNLIIPMFEGVVVRGKHDEAWRNETKLVNEKDPTWRIWPPKGTIADPLQKDVWIETRMTYGREGPSSVSVASVLGDMQRKRINVGWTVESSNWPFRIGGGAGGILPLVEKQVAGKEWEQGKIGFRLQHGKGKVLHLLAHFRHQQLGDSDQFALQRLLLNFMMEAREGSSR